MCKACRIVLVMISSNAKKILQLLLPLVLAGLIYGFLNMTDPATIGPGGILMVFFLLYLFCFSVIYVTIRFGYRAISIITGLIARKNTLRPKRINTKKAYYVASVLAFVPVTLLAMHSFSGLRLMDLALVMLFAAVATFYVMRRQPEA